MLEKSDLHIHLDEAQDNSKEKIIDILKRAEAANVKNLSFVIFNRVEHFEKGNDLYNLFKSDELKKYFSGKIITSVEMICKINDAEISPTGFDFNRYVSHVLLYDYDPNILSQNKFFVKEHIKEFWTEDLAELLEKASNLGLTVPNIDYFDYDKGHYATELYAYIEDNKDKNPINAQFVKDYPNKSAMQRLAVENPDGILFYKRRSYPTYKEVYEMAKASGAKIVLAHPAKHNDLFDTKEYIDAMLNIVKGSFWGLEGQYMLNSKEETEYIKDYAKQLNLKITGGSDFRYYVSDKNPKGEMYFIENGKKIMYVPQPSFLIKESVDGEESPFVMIEKDVIDSFKDFREYFEGEED